jgi:nicotinamidase-related amidase
MSGLVYGPPGDSCVHLCVDMQRLFAEDTPWKTPWMPRVLPKVVALTQAHPYKTIFTRFIPPENPAQAHGAWRRYYERWSAITLEKLDIAYIDLMPKLKGFVPPAEVVDKRVYAPWIETGLHVSLQQRRINTLVITGGETDVCVLATVLGAVDLGYRVILATDALCSSSDTAHDAQLSVYHRRYSMQVETALTADILKAWE